MSDVGDWEQYKQLVLSELERIDKGMGAIHAKLDAALSARDDRIAAALAARDARIVALEVSVAMLNVRAGMYGAVAGAVGGAVLAAVLDKIMK